MKKLALLSIPLLILLTSCQEKKINPDTTVIIEYSTPSLIKKLAGRNIRKNSFINTFSKSIEDYKKDSTENFITLFIDNFSDLYPQEDLNNIFKLKDETGNRLRNAPNEEIAIRLQEIEQESVYKTKTILTARLNNILGNRTESTHNNSEIKIYIEGNPSDEDLNKIITSPGKLEFWHTYKNTQVGNQVFESVNKTLSNKLYPGYRDSAENNLIGSTKHFDSITEITDDIDWDEYDPLVQELIKEDLELELTQKTSPLSAYLFPYSNSDNQWIEGPVLGYCKASDTAIVNQYLSKPYIKAILPVRNLAFMWEARSIANTEDGEPLVMLYLIRTTNNDEPLINGNEVFNAKQDFDSYNNSPMISLQFKGYGATAWADMTEQSANQQTGIAICFDNQVFSAPMASQRIEGGSTQITGGSFSGENGIKEAKDLANIINGGSLPISVKIKSIIRHEK
jgi:SecD/SecF fusion protein